MSASQGSIDFLFSLQHSGIKFGLDNTRSLLQSIDNPHLAYPSIHVAGTNGKGSTCAMIDSIFRSAGCRTGLYTSPHLVRFSERIRVSGREITDEEIVQWTNVLRQEIESLKCTFFEATTVMAMAHFREKAVEVAILETGLGGRLDSTNVVTPEVSVITSIGFDHQNFLGTTLTQIASEKAGIIKRNVPVVVGPVPEEAEIVIGRYAAEMQCDRLQVKPTDVRNYRETAKGIVFDLNRQDVVLRDLEVALHGRHQAYNAAAAVLSVLRQKWRPILEDDIRTGLAGISWPARLQMVQHNPTVVIDAAHNVSGMEVLAEAIRNSLRPVDGRVHLLIGLLKDKDCEEIISLIGPTVDEIVTATPKSDRALAADDLASLFRKLGFQAKSIADPLVAYENAVSTLNTTDVLIVTGSHYLLSEIMSA